MKSPETRDRIDAVLTEYAIDHIDWPDSNENLDRFLESTAESNSTQSDGQRFLFDIGPYDSSASATRQETTASLGDIVRRAYLEVFDGHSIDRLIADPDPNARFIQACWKLGAQSAQYELNHLLLNARKNNLIGRVEGVHRYSVCRSEMDQYLFASEFALRLLQDQEYFANQRSVSLDRILCEPPLAQRFEEIARSIVPGFSSLDYRWAAISIRKGQNRRATKANLLMPTFERMGRRESLRVSRIEKVAGFFWMDFDNADLYIGHAENLREQVERILELHWDAMSEVSDLFGIKDPRNAQFAIASYPGISPSNRESLKTQLVRLREPKLNVITKGLHVA